MIPITPCPGASGTSSSKTPAKPRSTPGSSSSAAASDTKPKKKKPLNVRFDPYINSKSVYGLDHNIIDEFLGEKDACLVMFYHPEEPLGDWAKPHFIRAAKTTERKNHAFAAVNCQKEEEMCKDMDAEGPYPFYRLFSRGFEIDSYHDVKKFLYFNMKRYVETAPIVNPKDIEPQRYRPCDFAQNIFCKNK